MTKTFRDLGVDGALCDALEAQGITHPFPIQELTLPLALAGNDLIGQARTGTGKTLGFGLPLLQRLDPAKQATQALVVVPTRELCLQVYEDLKIGAARGLTSIAVYGGVGYDEQNDALHDGVHLVVGTPGRLLDHLNRGNLRLDQVTQLVLDEADEMLDMGFLPDVERLLDACNADGRHTMLFSATMPTAIVKLARRYLDHPTFTRADTEAHETAPTVTQHFFQVHRMDKPRVLARVLQSPGRGGVYVFVRTKHMADRLVNELEDLGIPAIPIHGDLRQTAREKNLDRFRQGKATVLVATEVAARGLDVTGVTHVVNYDCPDDEKMYLHRIGRTARAGEDGVAVTFAEFNEVDRLNVIRKAVGAHDNAVEPIFSTSERLIELFDLPAETPWAHLARRSGGGRDDASSRGGGRDGGRGRDRDAKGDRAKGGRDATGGRGAKADRDATGDRERDGKARSDRDGGRDAPRGRERGGDAATTGDRRQGSTDGRSKNARTSEGTGGDHDARRDRDRAAGRPSAAAAGDRDDAGRDDARPGTEAASRGGGDGRTRSRSRTRTRDRGDVRRTDTGAETETREQRDGDTSQPRTPRGEATDDGTRRRAGGGRTRTARDEDRGAANDARTVAGDDTSDDAASTERRGRTRARARRGDRESPQADRQTGRPSDPRTGRDSGRRSRTPDDRDTASGSNDRGGDAGRQGRRGRDAGRDGGRDGGRGDADDRDGGRRSSRERSGGKDRRPERGGGRGGSERRGGRDATGGQDDATVVLQRRGRDARGDGQPQLARRVKIDHLP